MRPSGSEFAGQGDLPHTYIVMVSGANLLLQKYSKRRFGKKFVKLGFVTTRIVVAKNKVEACDLAIKSAREELSANGVLNEQSDPPRFAIEEVREATETEVESAPRAGFVFYDE